MARRRLEGLERVLGVERPVLDRIRQRRLVDLLRARPRRLLRARAHPDRLHHHGVLLLLHGGHVRRGDRDVPRGGRLLVVRPARVQRVLVVLRGVGGDAHLHGDDRHLGVLRPALHRRRLRLRGRAQDEPRRHHRRRRRHLPARRDQRLRRQGVDGDQRHARRRRLPHPGAARARRRGARARPAGARRQRAASASRRTWSDFILAIPIGMLAYTGIETVSNMAEEAKDEATTIPAAINRVRLAVFAIYFTLPAVALSALPVTQNADGEYETRLGLTEEEGGYAGDPVLGVVKQIDLGPIQGVTEVYVGLLAATILFLATNAGIIGVSRLVYSMGIHRQMPDALRRLHPRFRTPWIGILVFAGAAIVLILPGPGDAAGQHLLVRRAALVHDGARRRGAAARQAARHRAAVPRAGEPADRRLRRAALRARRRLVHGDRLRGHRRPQPGRRGDRRRLAARRHRWSTRCTATARGSTSPRRTRWRSPQPVVDHEAEYDSVLVHIADAEYNEQLVATAAKLAARKRRGIHILVTITVPNAHAHRRRDARGGGRRRLRHRAGEAARRRARLRPLGEGPRRPGRAADHRGGARHARGRGGHGPAAPGLRLLRVRQDARDRARRAALPRDHRVPAGARVAAAPGGGA